MNRTKRRTFLRTAGTTAVGSFLALPAIGQTSDKPRAKIKIGQIGIGHAHASGKMDALRKLTDDYEVVGVVEPDEALRRKSGDLGPYRGLEWMTEEQLLNTPDLKAVAVETTVPDLIATASRCVDARDAPPSRQAGRHLAFGVSTPARCSNG